MLWQLFQRKPKQPKKQAQQPDQNGSAVFLLSLAIVDAFDALRRLNARVAADTLKKLSK
jgi:hypothetical protein